MQRSQRDRSKRPHSALRRPDAAARPEDDFESWKYDIFVEKKKKRAEGARATVPD